MRCLEVREQLAAAPGDGEGALAVRRHLSGCAECRAEQQRFSSMRAALAGLETRVQQPPAHLLASLGAIPESMSRRDSVVRHMSRNRRAYVGGALVAALGAGAVAWRVRRVRMA